VNCRIATIGLIVLFAPLGSLQAGLYGPEDFVPFTIGADKLAEELPYVPNFKSLLDERASAANPISPLKDGDKLTYRGRLVERVEALWPAGGFASKTPAAVLALSQDRQVALATDLIRLGRVDDALTLLQPRVQDRTPDFFALVTLAQAHALKGDWEEAIKLHSFAFEGRLPNKLTGSNEAQTTWAINVEKVYVTRWLKLRFEESKTGVQVENHDVMPLFSTRFVNDRGEYEPGKLAAGEKAKLPKDAVAIVQQLLLWSPEDGRLLWLLGELTAAEGRLREASEIFDQLTWGRGFTNRKIFMEHRTLVNKAAEALPKDKPADIPLPDIGTPAKPDSKPPEKPGFLPDSVTIILVASLFGILVLGLVALQIRAIVRRWNR